uniref:Uncharacterized protein n=1 Tax=Nelumbo nucifera TaxID=4432 RepID=A0A823A1Y3_NELNU|nr:TPA_asm: hypothetical protein HUJ06_018923 [Nelumbo nucifera]
MVSSMASTISVTTATMPFQGDSEMAPSPAPSMVSGSPFALPTLLLLQEAPSFHQKRNGFGFQRDACP